MSVEALPLLLRAPERESGFELLLRLAFVIIVFVLPAILNARKQRRTESRDEGNEGAAEARRQAEAARQRELEERLREMARRAESQPRREEAPVRSAPAPKAKRRKPKAQPQPHAERHADSITSKVGAMMRSATSGLGASHAAPRVDRPNARRSRTALDVRVLLHGSPRAMRTAFLMSEILGKPKALQDERNAE